MTLPFMLTALVRFELREPKTVARGGRLSSSPFSQAKLLSLSEDVKEDDVKEDDVKAVSMKTELNGIPSQMLSFSIPCGLPVEPVDLGLVKEPLEAGRPALLIVLIWKRRMKGGKEGKSGSSMKAGRWGGADGHGSVGES